MALQPRLRRPRYLTKAAETPLCLPQALACIWAVNTKAASPGPLSSPNAHHASVG